MAIAFVQAAGSAGNSVAYAGSVAAGNLLVCCVGSAGNITQVSDGVNGNWTKAVDEDRSGDLVFCEIWYFPNTAGGTPTVSFTGGFSGFEHIAIGEYSGIATSTPLDQTAHAGDSSGADLTPDSGATSTTAQNEELLIGAFCNDTDRSAVWDAGWTERYDGGLDSDADRPVTMADRIVSSTGAYNASGTFSGGSPHWGACIATFKGAAAGGRTTKNTRAAPLGLEVGMNWRGGI